GGDRFLLLYASQTGQAEAIARRIQGMSLGHNLKPDLRCMSSFDDSFKDLQTETCIVVIVSTTDDGLVPEKARRFLRSLRKAPDLFLSGIRYAILGLGDTNYSNFCNGSRILEARFEALGAERFYETGYADDAVGLELVVEPWIEGLWQALRDCLRSAMAATGKSQHIERPLGAPAEPTVMVEFMKEPPVEHTWQGGSSLPFQDSDVVEATLISARMLTSSDAVRETWELTFQLPSKAKIDFKPGDSFGFLCPNRNSDVQKLMAQIGCTGGTCSISLSPGKPSKGFEHLPKNLCDVKWLLKTCCDLRGVPKKVFLRVLADHASDEKDRRRLLELSSREGAKDYANFVLESRTSIFSILTAFPSCKPSVALLLEHLPRLMPRYYSVCNWEPAQGHGSRNFKIIYKMCPFSTLKGIKEQGLCTGWLTSLAEDSEQWQCVVPVYLRQNISFRFPESLDIPIIMIGPGSGVAPFLSYLQWRREAMRAPRPERHDGETWLFTGCRHRHLDFLYEAELELLVRDGTLSNLVVAFSRDPEFKERKEDPRTTLISDVARLLRKQEAQVYVCGDARGMATGVRDALVDILVREGDAASVADALTSLKAMQKQGRYLQDVWT
ncbi:methionine synthase, putative, partial [Ixodes scapularis]